ncbi:MAG: hypothetical protein B7733_19250 [Myxococcales bacterium FL481]|nr:MAG: hypothetical protein B7733_19250 [Myxococcales bacterium FL481]
MRRLCLALGLVLIAGCNKPATPEACEQFADHFLKLLAKSENADGKLARSAEEIATSLRPKLVESCTKDGTASEVECVLASQSVEDVEKNCR